MHRFEHEKLDVYHAARKFNQAVNALTKRIGKGRFDLVDQLARAACSITRNIAEGAAEFSRKQKARYYKIARSSGGEAASTLDALVDYEIAREDDITEPKEILGGVVARLINLIKSMEEGK